MSTPRQYLGITSTERNLETVTERGRNRNGERLTTGSDRMNTGNHLLTETERTEPEANRELALIEAEQYFRRQYQGFLHLNGFIFLFATALLILFFLRQSLLFALPLPLVYLLFLIMQSYFELKRLAPYSLNATTNQLHRVSSQRLRKIIDITEYITLLCCLVIYSIVSFTPKYLYYVYAPVPYFFYILYFFYKSDIDETLTSYARCGVRIYLALQSTIIGLKFDNIIDWNWKTVLFLSWVMIFLLLFYSIGLCLISFCTCYYLATGEAQSQQVFGSLFLLSISTFSTVFVYFFTIGIMDQMDNGSPSYLQIADIIALCYAVLIGSCAFLKKNDMQLFLWRLLTEEDEDEESDTNRQQPSTDSRAARRRRKKTKKAIENLLPGNKFLVRFSSTYFKMATANARTSKEQQLNADAVKRSKSPVPRLELVIREERKNEDAVSPPLSKRLSKRAASTVLGHAQMSPSSKGSQEQNSPNMRRLHNQSMQMDNNFVLDDEQVNKILTHFASPRAELSPPQDNKLEKSNANCLICFDQPANSVFMDCGHGGICYECGLEIWKKGDECYLCRNVDVKALEGNQVKILAITHMEEHSVDMSRDAP